jgi:thioredoxin reductase
MSKPSLPRVAILGAGPIGLEAAVHARSLGLPVAVFEQGQPGAHVDRWGFWRMFTPFGMNVTTLGRSAILRDAPGHDFPADADLLTGREFRNCYLLPLAKSLKDSLLTETRVLAIGRGNRPHPPFRLLVRGTDGKERIETADVVLDCTGTFGRPNFIGDGGIPAVGEVAARQHTAYWPEDVLGSRRSHYAGKCVIVIGGGYSAASVVCDLATLAESDQSTWVIWLTNNPRTQPLVRIANDPFKERDRLAARANGLATRCDGNLEFHALTAIDELVCNGPDQGFHVAGRVAGKPESWVVDRVIAHVGYRPDPTLASELRADEPGYFVLGAKAAGSDFLLADGHEQIRRVFAQLQARRAA